MLKIKSRCGNPVAQHSRAAGKSRDDWSLVIKSLKSLGHYYCMNALHDIDHYIVKLIFLSDDKKR